jgi:DNA-binding MarR family transcriptional regulator
MNSVNEIVNYEHQPLSSLPADLEKIPPGISLSAVKALYYISIRQPSQGQLASLLGVSRADVTGITDRLERKGLVNRVACAHDRRCTQVSPTREGLLLAEDIFGSKQNLRKLLASRPVPGVAGWENGSGLELEDS